MISLHQLLFHPHNISTHLSSLYLLSGIPRNSVIALCHGSDKKSTSLGELPLPRRCLKESEAEVEPEVLTIVAMRVYEAFYATQRLSKSRMEKEAMPTRSERTRLSKSLLILTVAVSIACISFFHHLNEGFGYV